MIPKSTADWASINPMDGQCGRGSHLSVLRHASFSAPPVGSNGTLPSLPLAVSLVLVLLIQPPLASFHGPAAVGIGKA